MELKQHISNYHMGQRRNLKVNLKHCELNENANYNLSKFVECSKNCALQRHTWHRMHTLEKKEDLSVHFRKLKPKQEE